MINIIYIVEQLIRIVFQSNIFVFLDQNRPPIKLNQIERFLSQKSHQPD